MIHFYCSLKKQVMVNWRCSSVKKLDTNLLRLKSKYNLFTILFFFTFRDLQLSQCSLYKSNLGFSDSDAGTCPCSFFLYVQMFNLLAFNSSRHVLHTLYACFT